MAAKKDPAAGPVLAFTCEASALARALGNVKNVVPRKHSVPVISNLLITADPEGVTLTGTDLDVVLVERVAAVVEDPFSVTVSAHVLSSLVGSYEDGAQVRIQLTDRKLAVKSGRSRSNLVTLPADTFPVFQVPDEMARFTLPASDLRRAIDAVSFAMTEDGTVNYNLAGIYMHRIESETFGSGIAFVATDKARVAVVTIETDAEPGDGVIIPAKTAAELKRLLGDGDGDVFIATGDGKMSFTCANWSLSSKAIEAVFPGYDRPFTMPQDIAIEIAPDELDAALARAILMSSEKTRVARCTLEPGKMLITMGTPDLGDAAEEVGCTYDGEPMTIGLNAKFLRDNLARLKCDTAVMRLGNPETPIQLSDPAPKAARYAQAAFAVN